MGTVSEPVNYAGKFSRGDVVGFAGSGDGEPHSRQGDVLRIIGEQAYDPLVVIRSHDREENSPIVMRHASLLEMLIKAPREPQAASCETEKPLWRREAGEDLAVAVTAGGELVLDLSSLGAQVPVKDFPALIGALHECGEFRAYLGSAVQRYPDDLELALRTAIAGFPYPPADLG
jgi:hypothetical protein